MPTPDEKLAKMGFSTRKEVEVFMEEIFDHNTKWEEKSAKLLAIQAALLLDIRELLVNRLPDDAK